MTSFTVPPERRTRGSAAISERLETELPEGEDDVVLDLPISIYGGG